MEFGRESNAFCGDESTSATIGGLLKRLASGAAAAEMQLFSQFAEGDREQRSQLLDGLANQAAADCPYSLAALLSLVDQCHLTRSAVTSVVADENHRSDIEQSVLIAVARSIHQFRGDSKFTTWLFTLSRNVAVSEARKLKAAVYLDGYADGEIDGTGHLRRPADHWSRRMSSLVAEADLIRAAVDQLPEPFRTTVYLRDVEQLSYQQIADRQGVTMNTVKSRLSRGRRALAESWSDGA